MSPLSICLPAPVTWLTSQWAQAGSPGSCSSQSEPWNREGKNESPLGRQGLECLTRIITRSPENRGQQVLAGESFYSENSLAVLLGRVETKAWSYSHQNVEGFKFCRIANDGHS